MSQFSGWSEDQLNNALRGVHHKMDLVIAKYKGTKTIPNAELSELYQLEKLICEELDRR